MSHLFDRFSLLWRSAGGQTANRSDIRAFDELMLPFAGSGIPQRKRERFEQMLAAFDVVHEHLDDEAAVELALWFADQPARRVIQQLREASMGEQFILAVMLRKNAVTNDVIVAKDPRFTHDLHHVVRGATVDEYLAFERDRRDEFPTEMTPAAYAERRIAELETLRAGERIFLTSVMRARYEVQAMQNLARAVAWLRESTNRP